MAIVWATCSYCKGSGKAERLMEKSPDGLVPSHLVSHELADAWIKQDGDRCPLVWEDCSCPKCDGKGNYEIEQVTCKIF